VRDANLEEISRHNELKRRARVNRVYERLSEGELKEN
jgi:hypothetical protein